MLKKTLRIFTLRRTSDRTFRRVQRSAPRGRSGRHPRDRAGHHAAWLRKHRRAVRRRDVRQAGRRKQAQIRLYVHRRRHELSAVQAASDYLGALADDTDDGILDGNVNLSFMDFPVAGSAVTLRLLVLLPGLRVYRDLACHRAQDLLRHHQYGRDLHHVL